MFIPIGFGLSVISHELGHALGAKIIGSNVYFIHIWPGYELIPKLGKPVTYDWPIDSIATIQIRSEIGSQPKLFGSSVTLSDNLAQAIVSFLGSGTTWVISLICLAVLKFFKPQGIWFALFLTGAFFYYDILTYSIFPHFLDLPHLIYIGGNFAEPLLALSYLGMSQNLSAAVIVTLCIVQTNVLLKVLKQNNDNK